MTTTLPITSTITPIAKKAAENFSGNILFRIQALVFRINTQLSRQSQETQSRSQTMKREYRVASDKSAELTKRIGNWAPWISGISLALGGVGYAVQNSSILLTDTQKKGLEGIYSQLPGFANAGGQWITGGLSAEQLTQNSIKDLRNTEISAEANKSGEARDLQSMLDQVLANIRNLFSQATR